MATAAAPTTRTAQYMDALDRANAVRLARAQVKREVNLGERDITEVILNPPTGCHTMPIIDLLMAQRRWGKGRVNKLLSSIPMPEKKPIGSLTERQRNTLVSYLTSHDTRSSFQ